ncbi:MAG: sigma-54 dependent transcriptional regulator [Desulfobacteraceae bacterium]|jgi:two-component system response regulator GlrR|nr:sigma-54 dependent transcriptional regulator [Desulfobacteraceae bacterium]
MGKILVVDDDINILRVIKLRLEAEGYQVTTAGKAKVALELANEDVFDFALVDLKLNGTNGIQLMENLHQLNPEMPVIILTAYGTIESAVEAMRKGAYTYITKPFNYDELLIQTKNCLEKTKLTKEIKSLKKVVKNRFGFDSIIGRSQKMEEVLEQVTKAADSDSTIIIEGESGTGKELIAQTLHLASPRADKPFVAINCAAIPETLFESEMFGYEKGAFTGAVQNKEGLMFQAQGGTFFLDEISEMPLSMQVKLLRVMQEKEFFPVGGTKTIKMDIRFIASTNKNLKEEVKKGTFREDLFYRIHVIDIHLPPLRERQGDVPVLSHFFLDKLSKEMNKEITGFSAPALQKLMLHSWPGNVRELQNTVESAVAMATENIISEDLILPALKTEVNNLKPLKDAKENFERNYLLQLIELTEGNMAQAARLAGKYRADLYELLKKYDLKPSNYRKKQ